MPFNLVPADELICSNGLCAYYDDMLLLAKKLYFLKLIDLYDLGGHIRWMGHLFDKLGERELDPLRNIWPQERGKRRVAHKVPAQRH